MHIVIAPDKFKGSLSAVEVTDALAQGLSAAATGRQLVIDRVPVADGGEGTVAAALAGPGFEPVSVEVSGPIGAPVTATYALSRAATPRRTAIVELATASGIDRLPTDRDGRRLLDPLSATSAGTGELIRSALDAGATRIVLGVGGSACTDGGAGLLTALGARLFDSHGQPLSPGGGGLIDLDRIELGGLDRRLRTTEFVLAADVDHPLLGAGGAAIVFGPQKGAGPSDVARLEQGLRRYAEGVAAALGDNVDRIAGLAGAGAAGGVGFAALAVLGANLRAGLDVVAELVGLDRRLAGADLVITGEGSLDAQSLGGKSPVGVARRARAAGVRRVVAVCGRAGLSQEQVEAAGFDAVFALGDLEPDVERSMRNAATLLTTLAPRLLG